MSECRLTLRFTRQPAPELYRIEFVDEVGNRVHAFRGKADGANSGASTFQWTAAVRALASLALRAKLSGAEVAVLSGERGSPAAALDFALGKPPRWMRELFSQRGQHHHRYFRRTNPELKQPGPVQLAFNPRYLQGAVIDILLADRLVTARESLIEILGALDTTFDSREALQSEGGADLPASNGIACASSTVDLRSYLTRIFAEEAIQSLARIRVSSPGWCRTQLTHLAGDPLFQRITVRPNAVAAALAPPARSTERFGIELGQRLSELFPRPIRILGTNCQPGLIAIVYYLRDYCKLPLEFDPLHLYGVELSRRVIGEGESDIPTLISLGLGPSSPFLNDRRHGFSPLMIGPALNHRVVSSNGSLDPRKRPVGELLMVTEEVTSAMFSLASFRRGGATYQRSVPRHVEPDEVMEHLVRGERLHSLLWFPHNRFFPELLGGESFASNRDEPYVDFTMLLGNRALTVVPAVSHALLGAIRRAWHTLLEEPETVRAIAARVMDDESFYSYTRRALGLHYMNGYRAEGIGAKLAIGWLRGSAANASLRSPGSLL